MGAEIVLVERDLMVEPGEETSCEFRVVNSGEVVDQLTLHVVGDAHDWTVVDPPMVNLLPGDETTVRVTFRPPRSSEVPAGTVPFGIRAESREDPHASSVEEGEIAVAGFTDLVAELVPTIRRGRRRAKYRLVVDNNGNQEECVDIVGIDQDDQLTILVGSPSLHTQPGTATVVKTKVAPHKRMFRGDPRTHPFQLFVQPVTEAPENPPPVTVDGVMIQLPLVSKGLFKALVVASAALVALMVLWFALLKPTVESVARQQADVAASRADQAAERANEAADVASSAAAVPAGGGAPTDDPADTGAGAANGADPGPAAESAGSPGDTTPAPEPVPTSFRIEAAARPVTDGSFEPFRYRAPDGQALGITDLVLQNPRGDSGFLRIALNGEVILEVGLANFRDLDYHYVVPLGLRPGEQLVFLVNCTTPGAGANQCTPSASFSGRLTKP
ncbi:hypothetical protein SAMN05192558_101253 [Actinokineospora alba]|uniref:Hydrolytic protein n=1 Tax=Actinokineospora alba TaxID=504798 RepID=A0A1H0F724_9PSEU|nr:hypothetical protein [Actinokineospora alba]TDP69363.1 hypothetical protein C8E96_4949 [Actinokineospora alba]SDI18354.1 hypothetical protein SAMN05421871_103617 [Actinokineospora alba]SDN90332.1 hypothetical protein SAMN05192558_101253 [Actinokineospora alba]